MTRNIEYTCNLCRDKMGLGYGLNWVGNRLSLVNDDYAAKQLEHHLCLNCANQIEECLKDKKLDRSAMFPSRFPPASTSPSPVPLPTGKDSE